MRPSDIQKIFDESNSSYECYDFSDSRGSEYLPSDEEQRRVSSPDLFDPSPSTGGMTATHDISESSEEEEEEDGPGEDEPPSPPPQDVTWGPVSSSHKPRKDIPTPVIPVILTNLNRGSSELDCFLKVFPKSLLIFIAQCTNERLKKMTDTFKNKKENDPHFKIKARPHLATNETDQHEILIVLGVMIIMCYNKLPNLYNY